MGWLQPRAADRVAAACLCLAQKVDAELEKALAQLESEKATAMEGMDAQVGAGTRPGLGVAGLYRSAAGKEERQE